MIIETIILLFLTGLTIYFFWPAQVDWPELFAILMPYCVVLWLVFVGWVIYIIYHFVQKYW